MLLGGPVAARGLGVRFRQLAKDLHDAVPVDLLVPPLVGVGEQAVVTAALAAFTCSRSVAAILTGLGIDMDDVESLGRDPAESTALIVESAKDTGPALGTLDEKHPCPPPRVRQRLAAQLGVLQLELRLDATLQCVPQGGGDGLVDRFGEPNDADVLPVLHEGDDLGDPLRLLHGDQARVLRRLVGRIGVLHPPALDRVQPVADVVAVLAPATALIDDADGRGVAVDQLGQRTVRPLDGCLETA